MIDGILEFVVNQSPNLIMMFLVGSLFGAWAMYTFMLPKMICNATAKLTTRIISMEAELHAMREELKPYRELAGAQLKKVLMEAQRKPATKNTSGA